MCGRFSLTRNPLEAVSLLRGLEPPEPFRPRYNIAPAQLVWALIAPQGRLELALLHWGFKLKEGGRLINARAETVPEKPMFRRAFRWRRCIVWADGFYEWRRVQPRWRTPYYVRFRDHHVFGMAGLWEEVPDPRGGRLRAAVVLTTESNALLRPIHERMPLILPPEAYEAWLRAPAAELKRLWHRLRPHPDDTLEAYPVSRRVNDPRVDEPALIWPALSRA